MIATPSFAFTLSPAAQTSRLDADAAERLLETLVRERWCRLSSEYDNPLDMLFTNRVRQWTAGWDAACRDLYLLVWETDSWQEKATWRLYENGRLIFEETDGVSRQRQTLLNRLLESDQLPFAEPQHFLMPLSHYRFAPVQRQQAADALLQTIRVRPEIFEALKEPLFQAFETDLGNPDWPLLEVLKLHRLAHKNQFVRLFRHCAEAGLLRVERDKARLDQVLTLLQEDYFQYGRQVSPLFRPVYDQACNEFRRQVTAGTWRIRLRPEEMPESIVR